MDMLSKLPEAILCHILSLLPTKTSVACSVLSKRWKLLWTCVPVLDLDVHRDMQERCFDHKEYDEEEGELRFLKIVDKVYFLSRESPVKILRLGIIIRKSPESGDYFQKWVSACLFEELHLSICYEYSTFPRSFHHSNMVVLKLHSSTVGSVESCLFPKLKVLHLSWVSFDEKEGGSLENFLSACPILEELACEKLLRYYHPVTRICVPTLTSLVLQGDDGEYYRLRSEFVLETPALQYLSFEHNATKVSLATTASLCNLRKADITCFVLKNDMPYGPIVMKLLKNLPSAQFLKLSFEMMTCYNSEWVSYWCGLADRFDYSCLNDLPIFDNLVSLELSIPSCDCVLVPDLLQKFPNLKRISINKVFGIEEFEVRWKEPLQVPICLSSTLSSFSFQGFDGFEVEVKLVKYVTKHATVLKNITLETSSHFKGFEARAVSTHGLTMVSRGSEACQFHIK